MLSTLEKIIEKVLYEQFLENIEHHKILNKVQSRFRSTALKRPCSMDRVSGKKT